MPDSSSLLSVADGFLRSAQRVPDRPAVEVDGRAWSYGELRALAVGVAAELRRADPAGDPPLAGILGGDSAGVFAGVLGTLLRGHGYVPLGPLSSPLRARSLLLESGCRTVVADAAGREILDDVLAGIDRPVAVVFPDEIGPGPSASPRQDVPGPVAAVFYTSGTTGRPKGVAVSHANLLHHLGNVVDRYGITEADRLSHMFDLGFDLSAFDLFAAWASGACVVCPTPEQTLAPAAYADEARLTIWYSVPSAAVLAMRTGTLLPGSCPGLRLSLFCGEGLPEGAAAAWSGAAPGAIVENLYGPTETTLSCLSYRWDPECTHGECEKGILPIGRPDRGTSAFVAGEGLEEVAPGETGELLLAGPQVTAGYLGDPARTAASFVVPPGREAVHYRTGDLVRSPREGGPITILGRFDHQLQVRGRRVEPGDVEAALREITGAVAAVAIGWPVTERGADGIVAFVEGSGLDPRAIRRAAALRLPAGIVPRRIEILPELPRTPNGKLDRQALLDSLAADSRTPR